MSLSPIPAFAAIRNGSRSVKTGTAPSAADGTDRRVSGAKAAYKVDIADRWDPRDEDLIKVDGINVVVRKKQSERLKGTMAHFHTSGARQCLVVARLRPWAR